METVEMRVVARARSGFPVKFGIPRQSGLVEAQRAEIVFEPEFRSPEALRGLEGFSHLWLLWEFSANRRESWSPTVRPPRLGGNQRVGVFASRSPFRPSPIGISCVTLEGIDLYTPEGPVLRPEAAFPTITGQTGFLWTFLRRCLQKCQRSCGKLFGAF